MGVAAFGFVCVVVAVDVIAIGLSIGNAVADIIFCYLLFLFCFENYNKRQRK